MSVTGNLREKVSLQRKGANEAEMESGRGEETGLSHPPHTRCVRFTKVET